MDSFLTFLSNNYLWFLIAAGVFLFALIGLIIESSKKRKKGGNDVIESVDKPVESFRNENVEPVAEITETPVVPETIPEVAPEVAVEAPVETEITPEVVTETPVETVQPINEFSAVQEPTFEIVDDNVLNQPLEAAPVMDASPVFENVEAPLPEPNAIEQPVVDVLPEPNPVDTNNVG